MTTALDTNVLIALWGKDATTSSAAEAALEVAFRRGPLVVPAPVFAELMAFPGRSATFLDAFLKDTGISVDWELNEATWRTAGLAFQTYAERRRKQGDIGPRRILADFLIGAYALQKHCCLLTLDDRFFAISFPGLEIARF